MKTIVTDVHLKPGAGRDWDAGMRKRLTAARKRPGWVGGQLLRPVDNEDRRLIVGTWRTRGDWEGWHHDPTFAETRQRLDGLESAPAEHWWHDVVLDVRKATAPPPPTPTAVQKPKALRLLRGHPRADARALGFKIGKTGFGASLRLRLCALCLLCELRRDCALAQCL